MYKFISVVDVVFKYGVYVEINNINVGSVLVYSSLG